MENKETRRFTRADVEAFFARHWCNQDEPRSRCELRSIHLLVGLTPPTWHLRYTSTWQRDTQHEHTYYNDLIVMQDVYIDGEAYLTIPCEDELPQGLASVDEEDAAIVQRKIEENAALLRRHEEHAE